MAGDRGTQPARHTDELRGEPAGQRHRRHQLEGVAGLGDDPDDLTLDEQVTFAASGRDPEIGFARFTRPVHDTSHHRDLERNVAGFERSLRVGRMLAAHVSLAHDSATVQEQLTEAMRTRDLIGQATGLLMAREGVEFGFHGAFHEVRPDRIVQTLTYEGDPDGVALETLWFSDLGNGRARLRTQSLVDSFESRDAWLKSGMEVGVNEGYAKLEEMLADGTV